MTDRARSIALDRRARAGRPARRRGRRRSAPTRARAEDERPAAAVKLESIEITARPIRISSAAART